MAGDPRTQISVPLDMFRAAHQHAKREGWDSTSAWLRHLLAAWDGRTLTPRQPPQKQLSVRLTPQLLRRLDHLARLSGVSRSQAFALLIEQALPRDGDASKPAPTTPLPAPTAYEEWAALVLEAARATSHRFGEDKALIAGVLAELAARLKPNNPVALRETVRQLLPELNRRGLVSLSRADLPQALDPLLVARSEVRYLNASFHFVNL